MDTDLAMQRRELRRRSRVLHGHGVPDAAAELARVAAWCHDQGVDADVYGAGAFIESFEARLATLFDLPAARFLPSGTMAQGIAMRIWGGADGHFGMHPTSHLELHEQRGYSHLFGLRATLVGAAHRVLLPRDLAAVAEPLSALVVELPTRENGGQLPSWGELSELSGLARARGMKVHLDGARVWEAQAAYERPFGEIAALFDSIYVSFYKGIGALPGALLLGPRDFIDEARLWQRRMGGNLYTLLPNVASAASRLDAQLERFPAYLERARRLAATLDGTPGLHIIPDPPHVNMMHVVLDLDPDAALSARDRVAEETGLWLFGGVRPRSLPGQSSFELYVGNALMDIEDAEIRRAFESLLSE